MKKIKLIPLVFTLLILGCEQEMVKLSPPPAPSGEPGSADFTKFISIGNSLTAGYQAGALFNDGQAHSYPAIMAEQFAIVSENDEFNQPLINSVNGCYNPTGGCTRGRLILFDSDGAAGPLGPSPVPAGTPGVPAPYNTANAPSAYLGEKSELNNFGVPGILLSQVDNAATASNGYYARFATNPGVSTILGDALATEPTFFSFWLGNNDVLGYATSGGYGGVPLTSAAAFDTKYNQVLDDILGSNSDLKGVVANIPYVTAIPFFTTVKWNVITLDATTAGQLTAGLATPYNTFLNAMVTAQVITSEERDKRLLSYTTGSNGVLITDKTLTDLTTAMVNAGYTSLVPYAKARQLTSADLVCLSAGSYLGKYVDITGDGTPDGVNGASIPLFNNTNSGTASLKGDDLTLLPSEIALIKSRTDEFNVTISDVVSGSNGRLALADANTAFATLTTYGTLSVDGIPIKSTFAPPYGLFSEDGVHPNNRGSAYIARIFIQAINEKFGSTVPLPNISKQYSTTLPVYP